MARLSATQHFSGSRPHSISFLSTPTVPPSSSQAVHTIADPTLRAFLQRHPMACRLALAGATATATAAAARAPRRAVIAAASTSSAGEPARRIIRRRAPPGQQGSATAAPAPPAQPSVAEVRRAIGVSDDDASAAASMEAKNSAFMDLIATTPIGKPESEPERRLREAAEWVVDNTETRACEGDDAPTISSIPSYCTYHLVLIIIIAIVNPQYKLAKAITVGFGLKLLPFVLIFVFFRTEVFLSAMHDDISCVVLAHGYCPWSHKVTI